jgi:hypothetical protein
MPRGFAGDKLSGYENRARHPSNEHKDMPGTHRDNLKHGECLNERAKEEGE